MRVLRHAGAEIELARAPRFAVSVGDAFVVTAGCDKSFAMCGAKFGNRAQLSRLSAHAGAGGCAGGAGGRRPMMAGGADERAFARGDRCGGAAVDRDAVSASGERDVALARIAWGWCAACGAGWSGRSRRRRRPIRRTGRRRGARKTLLEAARRWLREIPVGEARAGDVLLFRMALGAPAKHVAIVSGEDRIIHAYWGRSVCETRLVPWWRRRIAAAFSFPGVED